LNYSILHIICITILVIACKKPKNESTVRWLGDIPFDKKIDKKDFRLCNENGAYQYFNIGNGIHYKGGKPILINTIYDNYDHSQVKKESGLIRIRFVVNCQGETDRFRMMQSDLQYQEKVFDKKITDQLMNITKALDGWDKKELDDGTSVDYWQFLVFKIVDGKIEKITP